MVTKISFTRIKILCQRCDYNNEQPKLMFNGNYAISNTSIPYSCEFVNDELTNGNNLRMRVQMKGVWLGAANSS